MRVGAFRRRPALNVQDAEGTRLMSGSNKGVNVTEKTIEKARDGIEQAETGETAGVERLDEAKDADPRGAEAAEQEASDGPEGRGLAR